MLRLAVGLLLPVVAVWLVLRAWRLDRAAGSRVAAAAVAYGAGVGLSALTTMWLLAAGLRLGPAFVAVDAVIWLAVCAAAVYRLRALPAAPPGPAPPPAPLTRLTLAARVVFAVVAGVAVLTAVSEYLAQPHGQWDAWAIWNQKARFLLRGGSEWTAELGVAFANPGHPLLVPDAVARLWAYAGAELTAAPALLAALFGAAIVALVVSAFDPRGPRAWLAGAALVAPGMYAQQVMSQQADVPLGFFIICTLVLLHTDDAAAWLDANRTRPTLLLAGLLAGLATWTKNEGIAFLAIVGLLVGWVVLRHGRPRQAVWWALGAAPAVLTVLWFKLRVAPVAPLYFDQGTGTANPLVTLFSVARHGEVLPLVWDRAAQWGGAMAFGVVPVAIAGTLVAALTPGSRAARGTLAAAVLMLVGYYAVYVVSPVETVFLINTSFNRLMVQLWPVLVLGAFSASTRPHP